MIPPILDDILFCEADCSYTIMHLQNQKRRMESRTLKVIENKISNDMFIRVHSKYLVNIAYINSISNDRDTIILTNGVVIPVSRRKKKMVKLSILHLLK